MGSLFNFHYLTPSTKQLFYMKSISLAILLLACISSYAQHSVFIDPRDGQHYETLEIGNHTWFKENIRFKTKTAQFYKNDSTQFGKYGYLYSKKDIQKVCPTGWHLPTKDDWMEVDTVARKLGIGSILDTTHWKVVDPKTNGNNYVIMQGQVPLKDSVITNETDFSLMPGGYKSSLFKFILEGFSSSLWIDDPEEPKNNYHVHAHYTPGNSYLILHTHNGVKNRKFYVRCVSSE